MRNKIKFGININHVSHDFIWFHMILYDLTSYMILSRFWYIIIMKGWTPRNSRGPTPRTSFWKRNLGPSSAVLGDLLVSSPSKKSRKTLHPTHLGCSSNELPQAKPGQTTLYCDGDLQIQLPLRDTLPSQLRGSYRKSPMVPPIRVGIGVQDSSVPQNGHWSGEKQWTHDDRLWISMFFSPPARWGLLDFI